MEIFFLSRNVFLYVTKYIPLYNIVKDAPCKISEIALCKMLDRGKVCPKHNRFPYTNPKGEHSAP